MCVCVCVCERSAVCKQQGRLDKGWSLALVYFQIQNQDFIKRNIKRDWIIDLYYTNRTLMVWVVFFQIFGACSNDNCLTRTALDIAIKGLLLPDSKSMLWCCTLLVLACTQLVRWQTVGGGMTRTTANSGWDQSSQEKVLIQHRILKNFKNLKFHNNVGCQWIHYLLYLFIYN